MKLSFVRNPRYILFAAVALAVLVSGGIITSNLLLGQTRASFESQGEYYATVYDEAEDKVFMKVNGYEVNYREFAVTKARFETNLANMTALLENKVSDDEWTRLEGTADNNPVRPVPEFMFTDDFKKMGETMEKHGSDAGALGALILEYAVYSRAVEEGHDLSDAEVTAGVAELKAIYEDNVPVSQAGQLGEVKGYISVVGEDVYWGTIFPRTVRMANAIRNWRRVSVVNSEGNYVRIKEQNRISLAIDLDTLSKVRVEVTDRSLVKATPAQGMAYMGEFLHFLYSTE